MTGQWLSVILTMFWRNIKLGCQQCMLTMLNGDFKTSPSELAVEFFFVCVYGS